MMTNATLITFNIGCYSQAWLVRDYYKIQVNLFAREQSSDHEGAEIITNYKLRNDGYRVFQTQNSRAGYTRRKKL